MADKKTIVTLNIGSQRVSLAQFSPGKGGGLVLVKYEFYELSGDPAADSARLPQIKLAVASLVESLGLAKSKVIFSLSGHSAFTRFINTPALDEENVEKLIAFEAQQNIPFPLNEVAWDYQKIARAGDDGESEYALVAIKRDSLDELTEVVEEAPLAVQGVDVAPMALYNAFRHSYPEVSGCALLIDVGARTTNLIFIEGDRVFTRSIPVGGAATTSAIASEFNMPFGDAEERKKQDGFVSLGGAYAEHEDPGIAAMSKVIRNTMTRLHSEITRTTSAYRQSGGSAPEVAYLCGGSAALPYLREFLNEKIGIEVEYFNSLKAIAVAPGVDTDQVSSDAHNLGELVGLALRETGQGAMDIDLVPVVVERRRDVEKRRPFLLIAGGCVLATLLAWGLYFQKATGLAQEKLSMLSGEERTLSGFDSKIKKEAEMEQGIREIATPLEAAVKGRTRFIEILNYLNSRLKGDKIWFTQIEPLNGGVSMPENLGMGPLWKGDDIAGQFPQDARPDKKPPQNVITHIRLYGQFRDSSDELYSFEEQLKQDEGGFFRLTSGTATGDMSNPGGANEPWPGKTRSILEIEEGFLTGQVRYDLELKEPIFTDPAIARPGM
ncbi:MAG: type IV pilus assembly protein PilM [Verrucomicrobiota bacterium]|nr:type IV pilus assembly protein PilM [Verrucomicrobiota bacterium]